MGARAPFGKKDLFTYPVNFVYMRVEQLNNLVVTVRTGSLRRAAEELHLSAPALGESIRSLEAELGVALLHRTAAGVTLTAEGNAAMPYVLGALDSVAGLREELVRHGGLAKGTVRLGTVTAATNSLLAPVIAAFRADHPGIELHVENSRRDLIFESLVGGTLDVGLITCLPSHAIPDGIERADLLAAPAVVCLPADHPLAATDAIEVADLVAQPLILFGAGYAMHDVAYEIVGDAAPSVAYYADNAETAKSLVADGVGVTLLPEFSVLEDPLVRSGLVTWRPLAAPVPSVSLAALRPASRPFRSEASLVLWDALLSRASHLSEGSLASAR